LKVSTICTVQSFKGKNNLYSSKFQGQIETCLRQNSTRTNRQKCLKIRTF